MLKDKILIALNNHELPNPIASYGVSLAKRLDRKATLTSVATIPLMAPTAGSVGLVLPELQNTHITEVKDQVEISLNSICLDLKKKWRNIDYEVGIGFLESTLKDMVQEESPFLLLIEGNSELTTVSEWFGTYETRMAEEIAVPTLIVPPNYFWKPVHDILYVMNMKDNKAKNIRVLKKIANELDSNLHIMIVAEENSPENFQTYQRTVETLKTFFSDDNMKYYFTLNFQTADEVRKMTDGMKVNWLAFEHDESTFVERVFSDLNSDRMILQAEIPVLVF